MPKKDNIAIKSIIIGLALMFATSLLGGCLTLLFLYPISKAYTIDKLIYTSNFEEVISGKTLIDLDELELNLNKNQFAAILKENNVIDAVINTEFPGYEYLTTSQENAYGDMLPSGLQDMVLFDCSRMFSYYYAGFVAEGETKCALDKCTCNHYHNRIDGKACYHGYWAGCSITSDVELTDEQVFESIGCCPVCYDVYSEIWEDGTYYYVLDVGNCPNDVIKINSGYYYESYETWNMYSLGQDQNTYVLDFKELVLDGFDFSYIYNFITNYDYTTYFPDADKYINPTNFSRMFEYLPVEKITIKNASGVENIKDLSYMFANCTNLKEIDFGNFFDGLKPTDISYMFYNCPNLEYLDLTNLDTSEVVNMSNMFNTGIKHSLITPEKREALAETYINEVVVPTMDSSVNNGTKYTLETFATKMNEIEDTDVYTREYLYVLGSLSVGYFVPITYDEISKAFYKMSFRELISDMIINPDKYDLPEDTDGKPYTFKEVKNIIDAQLITLGISTDLVYDGEFYATNSREEFIDYFINETVVPFYTALDSSVKYSVEDVITELNKDITNESEKLTKERFLIKYSMETGIKIPITWDEYVLAQYKLSFDNILKLLNTNPQALGFSSKSDGTPYTKDEVIGYLKQETAALNLNLVTEEELNNLYPRADLKPQGTLVLGGEGSKFVINAGTNVESMFGNINNFHSITTPNQIDASIKIVLPYTYKEHIEEIESENIIQTITNADAGKTYTYHVVEKTNEPQAKTWLTTGEIVAISVGGGSVFLGCIVALVLVIVVRKKPASRY